MATLDDETRNKLKRVTTATLCTALYKRGLRNQFIQDDRVREDFERWQQDHEDRATRGDGN